MGDLGQGDFGALPRPVILPIPRPWRLSRGKNDESRHLLNITQGILFGGKHIMNANRIFPVPAVFMTSEGKLGGATCLPVDKGNMLLGRRVWIYCFVPW